MPRCLLLLNLLFMSAAQAAPAWTWVDENGRRHFSDRPFPGATQIELAESRPSPPEPAEATAPDATARPTEPQAIPAPVPATVGYTQFDIINPIHEQTLWNIGGNLPIEVRLEPGLQTGHQIDVALDGQRMHLSALGQQFIVPDVYRGLHTLQAVVVDSTTGQEILRSVAITITVQQTSVLNPNNPNN